MSACPTAKKRSRDLALAALTLLGAALCSGCDDNYTEDMRYPARTDPLVVEQFESSPDRFDPPGQFPNIFGQMAPKELDAKVLDPNKVDGGYRSALEKALDTHFGTPARPKVGMIDDSLRADLKLDETTLAKGAHYYRLHCLHCHGLSGNGRGPTAPWVNPHPRDYRQGIFKFTSSSQPSGSRKPRRDDLLRTLRAGIEGTSMPSFSLLGENDLNYLASYVMHLSIRGQVEYQMLKDVLRPSSDKPQAANVENDMKDWVDSIVGAWKEADSKTIVPEAPFPENLEASVKHGYEVFQSNFTGADGKVQTGVGCISCHIDYGRADNLKYDAWGTIVRPVDVTRGVFRGGRRPIDLYWRIHSGINGAQMPASNNAVKSQQEIWDLVNFIQVLPYPEMRQKYNIEIK